MTLTTHAVTGATLATLVPNYPILGFAIGFGSHFILDAIPHWDLGASLSSFKSNGNNPMDGDIILDKKFLKDLFKIGIDGVLGLLLSFVLLAGVFHQHFFWAIFMGAIGGMTPDALQFVYFKCKHEPLISLQKFHIWVHPRINLDGKPILGIFSQVALIFLIVFIFR